MSTLIFILKIILLFILLYLMVAGVINIDFSNMNSSDYLLTIVASSTLAALLNMIDNG
jgi:hypothetical protein